MHAKDEQGSLRMVGAIGLLLATSTIVPALRTRIDSKGERECVRNRLVRCGIPFEIAARISDEVPSPRKMNRLYAAIEDEGCRNQLFVPYISDLVDKVKYSGSSLGWSTAVHKVWLTALADPSKGRDSFDQYAHLVRDHALLLSTIHSGLSPEAALDKVLGSGQTTEDIICRTVEITAPEEFCRMFPTHREGASQPFYRLKNVGSSSKIPSIRMQTTCGAYKSSFLSVFPLDGSQFITRIQKMHVNGDALPVVARKLAKNFVIEMGLSGNSGERKVLLLRALNNAFDQAARQNGFRSDTRVLGTFKKSCHPFVLKPC